MLTLLQALDVPLREQNVFLHAAGYAAMYGESAWDAPEMGATVAAIDRVLEQQEPHPALLMARCWNVLKTNGAATQFFGLFVDLLLRKGPRNLLYLMFDPEGVRPYIADWEEVAAGLLQRARREAIGHVVDRETTQLLHDLKNYPGVSQLSAIVKNRGPVMPITFIKGEQRWSYFSLVSTVGTPQCITAQELRIECMFPVVPSRTGNKVLGNA